MANTIYLTGFPGPAGSLDSPTLGQFPVNVGADPIDLQSARGLTYLLRASPADPDTDVVVLGPPFPAGMIDFTTAFQVEWPGSREVIYPAANFGRTSSPSDTPANTWVPGKLGPINYGVSLFDGIEPAAIGQGGFGSIVLSDPDGELDHLIDLAWDGATLDILRGEPLGMYSSYEVVARLTTAGILYDQRKKELRLRDNSWRLQKADLHGQRFTGAGGIEGDHILEGQSKPYLIGQCFNIDPVGINSDLLIYQVSCTSILAVDEVRDGGQPLDFLGDYATYDLLAAAAIDGISGYATCLAFGLIRLGLKAVYPVTADVRGDNDTINGQTYPSTRAQIARRIVIGRGNIRFTDGQIDFVAFNKVEQAQPDTCGFYWRNDVKKADALTEVMSGPLGWWAVRLNGLFAIGIMDNPVGSAALTVNYPEDIAGEPEMLDTYIAPRKGTYVGWRRNYSVQDPSKLAGLTVEQDLVELYGRPNRLAPYFESAVPYMWPTSEAVEVMANYWDESSAYSEARRQQHAMGVRRERWRVPVMCDPFSDLVGKVVQVNNFNRFGWGTSRKFICVGMSFASGLSVILELWG